SWTNIQFNEVTIGERIGGGAVGIVQKGWYKGREVALKTLFNCRVDDAVIQEYMDELNVLSQLDHPNIVGLLGACVEPPNLFFVMELCLHSLFHLLHECRRSLSTKEILHMALDVTKAMSYLHAHRPPIIHRDLKSLNLLQSKEGGPLKLCDFGLVRTKVTSAGTPAYMAPELLENRPFNKSVDVYAFGFLLWEMFSSEVPFRGYELSDIREAVLSGTRPKVPRGECPEIIRYLISRSWAEDQAQRPEFEEILTALEKTLNEIPDATHLEVSY
ncbi:unnamed protein product, partial [Choristocarpus tenellus]